jgi:hypothetical protein
MCDAGTAAGYSSLATAAGPKWETEMSRDDTIQALTDLGLDMADPGLASMTTQQLQWLLGVLSGTNYNDWARQKFGATTQDDPNAAKARQLVEQAVADGRIRPDDAKVWINAMSKVGGEWRMGGKTAKFSAGYQSRFDELAAELASRPRGRFDPDAEFTRQCLGATAGGRAVLADREARAQGDASGRTKTFSQVPADPDAAFIAAVLRSTVQGRGVLAASAS